MKSQPPVRSVAPTAELVTLEQAKEFLRVEDDSDNSTIEQLIDAAVTMLDGFSGLVGRALLTQTWTQKHSGFPVADFLRVPLGPLQSIVSIAYYDGNGDTQSFTSFHQSADAIGPLIVLQDGASWPSTAIRPDAVTITWNCGFGDAATDVPEPIATAVLQLVAHWFANREAVNVGNIVNEMPWGVERAIATYRAVGT